MAVELKNFLKVGDLIFPHPGFVVGTGIVLDPIPVFYRSTQLCARVCKAEESSSWVKEVEDKFKGQINFVGVRADYRGHAITVFIKGSPKTEEEPYFRLEKDSALKVVKVRPKSAEVIEVKFDIKGL